MVWWIIGGIIGLILFCYFLKNFILDLVLRLIAVINKPLDYIKEFLDNSQSSIIRLNFRQKLFNFILVVVAIVMLVSEYGTLREILNAKSVEGTISLAGQNIELGIFAAVAYITIATLLGYFALELIEIRRLFKGILYNDLEDEIDQTDENATFTEKLKMFFTAQRIFRYVLAVSFFIGLFLLASYQGQLAVERYLSTKKGGILAVIQSFYFALGFLTPVTAALALMSFDIFMAIIASFISMIITFFQKIVATIYNVFEAIINIIASPMIKILEFFNQYQPENLPNPNRPAEQVGRIGRVTHGDPTFIQGIGEQHRALHNKNQLIFICIEPPIREVFPSNELPINSGTTFSEVNDFLLSKHQSFNGTSELLFEYVDANGSMVLIDKTKNVEPYFTIISSGQVTILTQ